MPELADLLRAALKTIDDEKAREELEELKGKKFTLAEFRAAMDEAPEEERREFLDYLAAHYDEPAPEPQPEPQPEPAPEPQPEPQPEPGPQAKTRPGRKSGQLYGWDWDDEKQEAVRLDIPRVWQGADEPDEVEYEVAS